MTCPHSARLRPLLDTQRAAFLRDGPPGLEQRRAHLTALKQAIVENREALVEAVNSDFGHRSRRETESFELLSVVHGIAYLHRHLKRFMRPQRRRTGLMFLPGSSRVMPQPLGVVGIISPWNYPVALALMPLATALAAGNRAMLKPSESTPRTTAVLASMLEKTFTAERVAVVTGGEDGLSEAFSQLPFDHLVFTGSTGVGRKIMAAAAENLVPVTLELGGKSPAIVGRDATLEDAARSIAWGKLANAGQTCIAPDHVWVPQARMDAFIREFAAATADLYPNLATNPDYTTVINAHHFERLESWLREARDGGARIHPIGESGAGRLHARTFLPVLVTGLKPGMKLATEEIFGPVLPVRGYADIAEVIAAINAGPRPLALYYFGPDRAERREVVARTTSGGVCVDDTLLHYAQDDLPFGGVGASGMGAYHGREGFLALSHTKAVFRQSPVRFVDLVRPPFGKGIGRLTDLRLR